MVTIFNDRYVEILEISSAKDIVDMYIEKAVYMDTMELLTSDELTDLTYENVDLLLEAERERQISEFEAYNDR